jgi:hypothetical protein
MTVRAGTPKRNRQPTRQAFLPADGARFVRHRRQPVHKRGGNRVIRRHGATYARAGGGAADGTWQSLNKMMKNNAASI